MTQSRHWAVAGTMAQDTTAHGHAVEYRRSVVVSKAVLLLLLMPKPKGALHPGRPPVPPLSIGLGAVDHKVRQATDYGKPANTPYRHGATRSPGSRALNREQRSAAHTHKMWHTRSIKRQTCPRHMERIMYVYIIIYMYIYDKTRSTTASATKSACPLQHEHT